MIVYQVPLCPSGWSYKARSTKTTRHKNSFPPRPYPTWTTHIVTDLPVLLPFQSQRTHSPGFTYHWLSSPASSVKSTSYTCNHLPLPFISSLTSVTHRLVSRFSILVDAYLSARPSWNSSLPVEMQVYIQFELFILLPVHSSLSLLCWKPSLGYIE